MIGMNYLDNTMRDFFATKFTALVDEWKSGAPGKKRTDREFADAVNAVTKGGKCTYRTVSKWRYARDVPTIYMDGICKVLDVDPSVFFPNTHDDKYEHDTAFNKDISRKKEEYCKKIGLSLHFLAWITSTEGFAERFPFYSPLQLLHSYEGTDSIFSSEYVRMPLAGAKKIDDMFHIKRKNKTVILNNADLQYLKTVQDSLTKRLDPQYFTERSNEMMRQTESVNDRLYTKTQEGWMTTGQVSWEDLLKIDTYMKYVVEQKEDDENGET